MKTASEALIDSPVEAIDLPRWLAHLSDRDYQACSPAHRAGGVFYEDGVLGSVNVESVGGHLLIQHYLATASSPHRLVMHSRNTRAYVMHLFPATIEVLWTLEVERRSPTTSLFRCTVETRIPPVLSLVANLAVLPYFLRRHVQSETPLFARDIERKLVVANQAENISGPVS